MENNSKPRRIKVDPAKRLKEKQEQVEQKLVPRLDGLMSDALSIISSELSKYEAKSNRGVTLCLKEARAIQGYLDTLVKLSKEAREQARAQDLADLSDEELVQLAAQLSKGKKLADKSDETE